MNERIKEIYFTNKIIMTNVFQINKKKKLYENQFELLFLKSKSIS